MISTALPPSSLGTISKFALVVLQPARGSSPSKFQVGVVESSAPRGPWRTARSSAAANTARGMLPHAVRTKCRLAEVLLSAARARLLLRYRSAGGRPALVGGVVPGNPARRASLVYYITPAPCVVRVSRPRPRRDGSVPRARRWCGVPGGVRLLDTSCTGEGCHRV